MQNKYFRTCMLFFFSLLMMPIAQAHTLAAESVTLLTGFLHPLYAWDHLLIILVVGFWATQQNRISTWYLPLVFLCMTMVGIVIGAAGMSLLSLETGILSSLLVVGLLLAFGVRLSLLFSMVTVGLLAMYYSLEHGTGFPQEISMVMYGLGYMAAITLLLVFTVQLGLRIRKMSRKPVTHGVHAISTKFIVK